MEEGLKIQIGADVTELIAGLSKASAALKAFGSTGTAGAKEIEKAIKQLSKSTKGLSGEELERVNTLIAKLRDLSVQLGTKAAVSINILGDAFQGVSADAATLTPQIEKLSDAITNIPEGSFAVSLDADVASYLPKIEGASEALRQLGQTGIIAGNQAEAALIELGKAAQQAGTADLLKLNAAIVAIGSASDKFKATGVQAFDEFGKSVQSAASKVAIVGPAIANAVKEVEVIKASGFTIKINAETQEAIQGLRFVSKETKALGVTGEASIGQVKQAIIDLNKQLKNGGGGAAEIQRLNTALAGLKSASANFNVDGSVKNLGVLETKAKDVKEAVTDLSGVNVTTTFNVQGTEASKSQVDSLGASIDQVRSESDVEILLNVDAQQAISNLTITSDVLERLGTTGKGSIAEVNIAIAQLQQAARNASGVELAGITLALKNIGESSSALGINAANGFGLISQSAESTLTSLGAIPPAIQKIADVVNTVDGAITITPSVNEQPAVDDLNKIESKVLEVKDSLIQIQQVASKGITPFDLPGINESKARVAELKKDIADLRNNSEFRLELTVDAKTAINNLDNTDEALDRLGRTGKASLRDVQQALKFLESAAKKPGASLDKINAAMQQLVNYNKQLKNVGKQGFDQFGNALDATSKKLTKVRPASQDASQALIDLGRVAQDAPFGIIGIANNIDPLIQKLGSLGKSAGGPLGALKELGGALIGPAGIAFAVSAVTSTIVAATQKYGSLGNAIDALFGKVNRLKESQKSLLESQQEANKGAAEELVRLKTLTTIAQDTNRTYTERKQAIKALDDEFPTHFKTMKEEEKLNGDLTGAIRLTTKAILDRARARAVETRLVENQTKILDVESKRNQLLQDREALQKRIGKQTVQLVQGEAKLQESTDSRDARKELSSLNTELQKLGEELLPIAKDAEFLQKELEKVGGVKIDTTKDTGTSAAKEEIDLLKRTIEAQEELNKTKAKTGAVDSALLANKIKLIQLEAQQNGLAKESTNARIAALKAETNLASLNERIALLEKQKAAVGLLAKDEQKLINLRAQAAKIEFGQGAAQDVITAGRIEGLEADIKHLEELRDKVGLLRSEAGRLTDLKLDLFDLKNINSDLTPAQIDELRKRIIAEINTGSNAVVMRIPTIIEPVDTREEVIKKVSDLFPKEGFKIPINVAAAVQPLPATIGNKQRQEADLLQLEAVKAKYKDVADTISQEVAPVFASLFDVIGKDGASALDVLGDALKQIIKKLIAAAAQAAIFSAIMSVATGGIPGGGAFGKTFISSFKGLLGLGSANLGSQNRQFVRGNAANFGRERLVTEVRGANLALILERNQTNNNRYY